MNFSKTIRTFASKRSWIIDTDAGVDDAQALVLLLSQKNLDIKAITCVNGNVDIDKVVTNVTEICRICNRQEIPVYKGASEPLIEPNFGAGQYHGSDGLGNYWSRTGLQPQYSNLKEMHASNAINEICSKFPESNILTLGPLTNLALAYKLNPKLNINQIVAMAGTMHGDGNCKPVGEFNIAQDPEAAKIVFQKSQEFIMVPWETISHISSTITDHIIQRWTNKPNSKSQFIRILCDHQKSINSIKVCDSVPAAIVIDPTIITKKHRRFVDVELQGNITRGMTVIHWDNWNNFKHSRWGIPREHVDIIEEINTTQFWEMLISSTD